MPTEAVAILTESELACRWQSLAQASFDFGFEGIDADAVNGVFQTRKFAVAAVAEIPLCRQHRFSS